MQTKKIIPHHPGKNFLSNILELRHHPIDFIGRNTQKYGNVFSFRFGHRTLYIMNRPELVQHILQKNHRSYRKAVSYRKLKLLLGNGLLTSEGDEWAKNRKLIQPAFHKKSLAHFADLMTGYAAAMTDDWNRQAQQGRPVNVLDEMSRITLKIVTRCLLGLEIGEETRIVREHLPVVLEQMMKRIFTPFNSPTWLPLPGNRRFNHSLSQLTGVIRNIIASKRSSNGYGNDLLSMLMQVRDEATGEALGERQLVNEVLTFFLAGHETSAVAAAWTFYLLSAHPGVETKMRAEVEAVLQGRLPSVDDLPRLEYTKWVIQEALRLYPPLWVVAREAIADNQVGNYVVCKGHSLVSYIYLIHRDPQWWENPDQFIPERFAREIAHPFAYLPFGAGPRQCVGNHFAMMELQLLMAVILQRCRFRLDNTAHPGFAYSLTLRPKEDLMLWVEK